MKSIFTKSALPLVALMAAFGLGACGKAPQVTEPASVGRGGAGTQVVAGCPTIVANDINTAFDFNVESGAVVQYREGNRIRIQTDGEVAEWSLGAAGPCAASDIPSMTFIGGHANVFISGTTQSIIPNGQRLSFGALLFPGVGIEDGVVVADDAAGNVLEIIWPELAGLGAGSPIMRVQLAEWNTALVNAGTVVDVTWDCTVEQDGIRSTIKGHCEGMSMDGTPVIPGGFAILPCPTSIAGTSGPIAMVSGDIVQFRNNKRIRFEGEGDIAGNVIEALGACAASETPSVIFNGGTANVFRAGTNISVTSTGQQLSWGNLAFPGLLIEPGIVVADDVNGNVMEIIWPGLAGLPPGPPVFRLQLARWNSWIRTGRRIDIAMDFNVTGPDASTASYQLRSNNVLLPQSR